MARGVRWYLVGSVILVVLGVLAGCSGGNFFAEREPWRHEAEAQCLGSGAVKEGAGKVRIRAISGPGICGADFPLKVSALGEDTALGYTDDLRPPSAIPNVPIRQAPLVQLGRCPSHTIFADPMGSPRHTRKRRARRSGGRRPRFRSDPHAVRQ